MKIEITNQQKLKRINLKNLEKYLKSLLKLLNLSSKKVSFLLCDNDCIKKLNRKYFRKYRPTDVIAFPLCDEIDPNYLGEVVVSLQEAVKVADKLGLDWRHELMLYIIHGILHLTGYSDSSTYKKKIMENRQNKVRELFLKKHKRIKLS